MDRLFHCSSASVFVIAFAVPVAIAMTVAITMAVITAIIAAGLSQMNKAGNGRHALLIQDKQQVISRRRKIAVGRSLCLQDALLLVKGHAYQPLFHVKRMRYRACTHQHHGLDVRSVMRLYLK